MSITHTHTHRHRHTHTQTHTHMNMTMQMTPHANAYKGHHPENKQQDSCQPINIQTHTHTHHATYVDASCVRHGAVLHRRARHGHGLRFADRHGDAEHGSVLHPPVLKRQHLRVVQAGWQRLRRHLCTRANGGTDRHGQADTGRRSLCESARVVRGRAQHGDVHHVHARTDTDKQT